MTGHGDAEVSRLSACSLSRREEGWGEGLRSIESSVTPHPNPLPLGRGSPRVRCTASEQHAQHKIASSSSAPGRSGCACHSRWRRRESRSCLIEALGDDNFLEQVPRAGTNHPATLELFDRIGLYEKLEPRGIIAPKFHYWDRQRAQLIAEFDHACSRTTPVSLRAAMRAHQDRRRGAEARQGASQYRAAHGHRRSRRFTQDADGVTAQVTNPRGRDRNDPRRLSRQRRGRTQHRPQGPRHRVRRLHLSGADAEHRGRLRLPQSRLYRAQLHLRSGGVVEPVPLEGPARPLARALPDRPNDDENALTRPEAMQARLQRFLPTGKDFDMSAATSTPCTSGWRRNSAPAARSWPATPRT